MRRLSETKLEMRRLLDSEYGDENRWRLRQCALMLQFPDEGRRRHFEANRMRKIGRRVQRNLNMQTWKLRRIPLDRCRHLPLAAAVRSRHFHASALALHLFAAGVFRSSQMRIG